MISKHSMLLKMHMTNAVRVAFVIALALAGYWGVQREAAYTEQLAKEISATANAGQAGAQGSRVEQIVQLSRDAARSTTMWLAALALVLAFLIFYGGIVLVRMIGAPLLRGITVAERVAAGDLSTEVAEVTRKDEAGQLMRALDRMTERLAEMALAVRSSGEAISQATAVVASDSGQLAGQAEEEAMALQQTARSVETMSETVASNADHAAQAKLLAEAASQQAIDAGAAVSEVVGTVQGISQGAQKIAEITGLIDGIAFQTNILALNAAVEAARAGDQGRGFSVVAAEVRALAQRSATAAKEIKTLIESSLGEIRAGNALVTRAGAKMQGTVDAVRRLSVLINDIAVASREQAAGIREVGQTMGHLDQVVQQNAVVAARAADAAGALEQEVLQLTALTGRFKLREGPAPARSSPQSASPSPRRVAQSRAVDSAQTPPVAVSPLKGKEAEVWAEF
jgi:methyl-accepting chemotaxis protein